MNWAAFDQLLQRPVLSFILTRTRYVLPACMYCAGIVTSGVKVESSPLSHRALISYALGALGSYPGAFGFVTSASRHSIAANVPVVSVKLLEWKRTASAGKAAGPV